MNALTIGRHVRLIQLNARGTTGAHQQDWDDKTPWFLLAYRTAQNYTTKHSQAGETNLTISEITP